MLGDLDSSIPGDGGTDKVNEVMLTSQLEGNGVTDLLANLISYLKTEKSRGGGRGVDLCLVHVLERRVPEESMLEVLKATMDGWW
jgi:hypothetical protein